MPGRRSFIKSTGSLIASAALRSGIAEARSAAREFANGATLPVWEPGILEIHHIDTGRGNASLILGPDGTSILVDAGEAHSAERSMAPARPDATRGAGEWIARYVQRQLKRTAQPALDVMLLTHLHGDHIGEPAASSPQSKLGDYQLTGAASVAEAIQVRTLIDRGWPDYNAPAPPPDPTSRNYIALAKSMAQRGTAVQQAKAGSLSQLALRHDASRQPAFNARILSVNGRVWSGTGEDETALFPPLGSVPAIAAPSENMCCVSLRLQYGTFRYYSGGDLTSDTSYGRYPWHDTETPVANAAGPVSVAVANHHGYFDACGPAFVRALRPRVWVLPTWAVSHPAMNVLANIFSADLYPGDRSVFATGMAPEALLTNARFSDRFSSSGGHVVIRVAPPGDEFTIHVINAQDELGIVEREFGPFLA